MTLASLANAPRWVAWQVEGRGAKSKPTKVPYAPDGRKAKADDPDTWGTRTAALSRANCLPKPFGIGGIGIELGAHDDLAIGGIDLDTCRAETGDWAPWALAVMARFKTYAEVSPSGTGAKLFFLYDPDDLPALRRAMQTETGKQWKRAGAGDHPPGIEFYVAARYFAVTDDRLPDAPATLRQVPMADLLWLIKDAGPAVAAKGASTKGARAQSADQSRSALAMSMGRQVKRDGGTYEDLKQALDADPRTADWLVEKGTADGERELRRIWDRAGTRPDAGAPDDIELTEDGVARVFEERHRDLFRFCEDTGQWLQWSGTHWATAMRGVAFTWARDLVRQMNRTADFKGRAITGKASFAGAVETYAKRGAMAIKAEALDRDTFLLGTPGGTVDLRTGILRPASPAEFITKTTAVAPAWGPPPATWLMFLDDATSKDAGLIEFLRRWCGYALTGDIREHALLFGYGPGGNGKSVFLNTVSGIMGDYATTATMDAFTASQNDKHTTDMAMLRGARLVTASETEEGRAWAETRIKQMTGGDPVTARFMRQDNFTFRPQFKLTIVGNHKPVLKNVDDAARRRFNIVPFVHKPASPDRQLEEKLKAEWPAILRWMIEGCLAWQRDGLTKPAVVAAATAEYFDAQDAFGQWLAECCDIDPTPSTKPGALLNSFIAWCQRNGEQQPNRNKMRGMLERVPGLRYATNGGTQWVRGIALKPDRDDRGGGGVEAGGGYSP
ncbi:phage/plasmid primase, P4 family [Humitalea rosea]|uniref:phage/plasmid primase, P4 family n=1 Tax=Humitalea rosea TaxID=990373 RepID=UPI001FE8305F|nr:phage/plasmid primase, P4 family [Humitalea rosea]